MLVESNQPKEKEGKKDMSLSRKLLESMGLDSDKVSTIIENHVETVDALKAQIATFKADAEKYHTAADELASVKAELEGLKSSGGDWQKKYETEHSLFEEYKNSISAKETLANKASAYKALLKEAGVSEKVLDKVLKTTDLSEIELEDGKVKDSEKAIEAIKADWSEFIVQSGTHGADTKRPPENHNKTFSHEEIMKMTPEEINSNWESIKNSMKGTE